MAGIRKAAIVITLAVLLTPLLVMSVPPNRTQARAQEQVTFSLGDDNKPDSLNPLVGIEAPSYDIWGATYDLLVDFDQKDLSPAPGLAESWENSVDGKTWTYHLFEGMKWSDGQPITADDVAFTYNMILDDNVGSLVSYLSLVESVKAVDDLTVEIKTTKPTSLMTSIFIFILPEHIWGQLSSKERKTFENIPAVGSGPFALKEYNEGQSAIMERNPHYRGEEPQVDRVIYRFFNNPDAVYQALKAGEIDFMAEIPASLFKQLEGDDNFTTQKATISSFDEIGLNVGSDSQDNLSDMVPHGDPHPALDDVVVRQAMAQAVDKQALVDKVLQGYGEVAHTVVTPAAAPAFYHYEPSEEEIFEFDLDKANQMLEDAGYEDTDGDDVREMPGGGEPLLFRYLIRSENQDTIKTSQFVKGWFKQIGIDTEVTAASDNKITELIQQGKYDLFHWGWFPDVDPDFILSVFTCDQRPPNGASYRNNDNYYCTAEFDQLYQEQKTIADPQERKEIVWEMQRMILEASPYIMLWYDQDLEAYNNSFTGFLPQPDPEGLLLNNYTWANLEPVTEKTDGSTTRSDSDGGSSAVWIGVAAAVVLVGVGLTMARRRLSQEDRA
ncbi:MAG: ABC transporter substrate-binding protein [Solirubrobacterales bacterium]|nr:ABC transporter substrate-binding protein [Solirubrobacterales bacterium]